MFDGFLMSMSNSHFLLQNRLQDRIENNQLLVDTKHTFPVLFPYTPSALSLETVHIPASLSLDFLTRVWHLNLSVSLWALPSQICGLQRPIADLLTHILTTPHVWDLHYRHLTRRTISWPTNCGVETVSISLNTLSAFWLSFYNTQPVLSGLSFYTSKTIVIWSLNTIFGVGCVCLWLILMIK